MLASTNITDHIVEALKNNPQTKDAAIDVVFNQGIVTLTGMVKSEMVREAAENVVKTQSGIISVINELNVQR